MAGHFANASRCTILTEQPKRFSVRLQRRHDRWREPVPAGRTDYDDMTIGALV